jgi:hypothetical protein
LFEKPRAGMASVFTNSETALLAATLPGMVQVRDLDLTSHLARSASDGCKSLCVRLRATRSRAYQAGYGNQRYREEEDRSSHELHVSVSHVFKQQLGRYKCQRHIHMRVMAACPQTRAHKRQAKGRCSD